MRRSVELAFAVASSAIAASCSPSGASRLELEGLHLDYGFLVILDEQGTPTRVTAPFGISGDEIIFGQLPSITFVNNESQFVLVGLDQESINTSVGGFERVRAAEIGATLMAPPGSPRRVERNGATVLATALPQTAKLFSGELISGAVRLAENEQHRAMIERRVTLDFPVDPEYCRVPEQTPLEAFTDRIGAFRTVLPDKANVIDILWLDPDRLFAVTWTGVAVLRPGRALEEGPSVLLLSPDIPTPNMGLKLVDAEIDPRTRTSTSIRVLLTGQNSETFVSKIWELEIRGDQIELISELEHQLALGDIAILQDGRQFVASSLGRIYERDPNTGALNLMFTLITHFEMETKVVYLHAVDDEGAPLIAATEGRVHIYDAVDGRFRYDELFQVGIGALDTLDFTMLETGRTADGELEIWAGAERGSLYRKIGSGEWERVALEFPPRFMPCFTNNEQDGSLYYPGRWWDATISEDYVHMLPNDCTAVLQVRRSDKCVSVLPRPDFPIALTDIRLLSIDAIEGHLAVAGQEGVVYRSTW